MDHTARIDAFLTEAGVHPDLYQLPALTAAFLEEMARGLTGAPSSLSMIPTYLRMDGLPRQDEPVIVLDAGGTRLRAALVTFRGGAPAVSDLTVAPMPGSAGALSAREFFEALSAPVRPLLAHSRHIALCISFDTEILPDRDGRLNALSKEVRVAGLVGRSLRADLLSHLQGRGGGAPPSLTVLNDAAATLLGGAACDRDGRYSGYAGLVVATGVNACYLERGPNLRKLPGAHDMPVNMESGGFAAMPIGRADRLFDAGTDSPGVHLMEKMVSGAYQGGFITTLLRLAAGEGLLSPAFGGALDGAPALTAPQLSDFLRDPGGTGVLAALCQTEDDRTAALTVIDRSFSRAAKLVCANLAAIAAQTGAGGDPRRPLCVTADGSFFYRAVGFQSKLDAYVRAFVTGQLGRHLVFRRLEHGNLPGAALAALLSEGGAAEPIFTSGRLEP